ncbi:hypothetical protein [Streptomyces sp. H27-D2]|uniref:hypothetical protein n=1 Tax=Streptomyces sp. H27-D2 TaxID=3046304 RepID=UPI002DBC78FB|nr:hypothetical protein [Streptomyces sp. H27-D2]MEC4016640.1 hypothetical protein [Streptomyces sp. H27-D2]
MTITGAAFGTPLRAAPPGAPPATKPPTEPLWHEVWPSRPATSTAVRPPNRPRRTPARMAAALLCLVLGLGLTGGAATGIWLSGDPDDDPASGSGYTTARALWHNVPVDELFPRTLRGERAGPGGADRRWTRVAVAPDSGCADAFDPLLAKALSPVGCKRLLRATYVDATSSGVTTVGIVFTKADRDGMRALHKRFAREDLAGRGDLLPRPYRAEGTAAAGFGAAQRASWTLGVLTDVPAVVYAVSGFADGREVADPRPAAEVTRSGSTATAGQSGLGHDAHGIAGRVERLLRKAADRATEPPR